MTEAAARKVRTTRSLGFRLSLLVSLAILFFGMFSIYIAVSRNSKMYRDEKERQWSVLIESITPNLTNLLASSDTEGIRHILDRVTEDNDELSHIFLVNEYDEVIYSINMEMEGAPLEPGLKEKLAGGRKGRDAEGMELVQYEKGIQSGDSRLGALYIGFTFMPSLERERLTSILTLERAIQGAVRKYLEELDYFQVDFITQEMIKGVGEVEYFKVLSGDGTIVSSPDQDKMLDMTEDPYDLEILSGMNMRKPVWKRIRADRTVLEVTLGMFDGAQMMGIIQVGYDISSLNESRRRSRLMLFAVACISVLAAVLIAWQIARRISRPVAMLADAAGVVGSGDLDVEVTVNSGGDELRLLGTSFNQMVKGLKERDFYKDTFSRYVTKQVADELMKNPGNIALGGKKQEVTILFSDIRGFTTFSEGHTPEEVISHLNEYLSAMVDVIFKYEGTLDKYIGDAIMAVFGSPIKCEDDPQRAVRTAFEMQAVLENLNKKWEARGLQTLSIGIGVNTGEVIVGNIGDVRRMEYTVIGDNVNLASRIEGLTKSYKCPIIISASTYDKVRDIVTVKELEAVVVKGKTRPVQIYELLDVKS